MIRGVAQLLFLWTVAGLLARSSGVRMIGIFGVTPDLATLLVVYWALAGGARAGVLSGFLVGLVVDAETGRFLGLTAGTLAGVGFLTGTAGASLHRERPPAQFVVLFFATVVTLAVRTLFATGGDVAAWLAVLPVEVALRAVYTALVGPLVYVVTRAAGAPDFLAHGPTATQPRS